MLHAEAMATLGGDCPTEAECINAHILSFGDESPPPSQSREECDADTVVACSPESANHMEPTSRMIELVELSYYTNAPTLHEIVELELHLHGHSPLTVEDIKLLSNTWPQSKYPIQLGATTLGCIVKHSPSGMFGHYVSMECKLRNLATMTDTEVSALNRKF